MPEPLDRSSTQLRQLRAGSFPSSHANGQQHRENQCQRAACTDRQAFPSARATSSRNQPGSCTSSRIVNSCRHPRLPTRFLASCSCALGAWDALDAFLICVWMHMFRCVCLAGIVCVSVCVCCLAVTKCGWCVGCCCCCHVGTGCRDLTAPCLSHSAQRSHC